MLFNKMDWTLINLQDLTVGNVHHYYSTVDGGWSTWSDPTNCSPTCGANSTKTRHRTCTRPTPQNNGKECEGEATETLTCAWILCPGNMSLPVINRAGTIRSAADTIRIRYGPCRYDTYSIRNTCT